MIGAMKVMDLVHIEYISNALAVTIQRPCRDNTAPLQRLCNALAEITY
jgi:hypothetical protein